MKELLVLSSFARTTERSSTGIFQPLALRVCSCVLLRVCSATVLDRRVVLCPFAALQVMTEKASSCPQCTFLYSVRVCDDAVVGI